MSAFKSLYYLKHVPQAGTNATSEELVFATLAEYFMHYFRSNAPQIHALLRTRAHDHLFVNWSAADYNDENRDIEMATRALAVSLIFAQWTIEDYIRVMNP